MINIFLYISSGKKYWQISKNKILKHFFRFSNNKLIYKLKLKKTIFFSVKTNLKFSYIDIENRFQGS